MIVAVPETQTRISPLPIGQLVTGRFGFKAGNGKHQIFCVCFSNYYTQGVCVRKKHWKYTYLLVKVNAFGKYSQPVYR